MKYDLEVRFGHALSLAKLTQRELSERAGVQESYVSTVKKGRRPPSDKLLQAMEAAGIDTEWVFEGPNPVKTGLLTGAAAEEWQRQHPGRHTSTRVGAHEHHLVAGHPSSPAAFVSRLRALAEEAEAVVEQMSAARGSGPQDDLDEVVAALRAADSDGTLVRQATGVLQALLPTSAVNEGKRSA